MELQIWLNGSLRKLKPTDIVKTTRAVHSFASYNSLRDCLFKSQGGYYKLTLDGVLIFVCPSLNSITFEQLYNILID
jgi:hypothetical protein